MELQPDLELTKSEAERLLGAWLGGPVVCSDIRRLEGGKVNTVLMLEFDQPPHEAVVKLRTTHGDRLAVEARALEYLRSETACPVPRVYLQDSSAGVVPHAFLLLERVPGVRLSGLDLEPNVRADVDSQLAAVLGELHSHHSARWGGVDDPEASMGWVDLFSARLAEARAHPAVPARLSEDVLGRIDEAIVLAGRALSDKAVPTLVHGDVWDGNLMVRPGGSGWELTGLLDPDLQFADVEFELAYLEVFDTPQEAFFTAYVEHQTMRPGYDERRLFYWLHTALVHVALFGDEYYRRYTAQTAEKISRLS